ncbi:Methylphloroacetophenone synthase [Fusarium oxysporum f. sp. rapae]|uniref:Methylphloroacetophenone synthase n=1 Tax=Fusarium oxysporum f. sp. rapae TaxID=485398 RepID=A0A8J5TQ63_FUSOX|nr:Methylphloroacetophenone synthase [Fusarium oxysporum f. sp. rapae]
MSRELSTPGAPITTPGDEKGLMTSSGSRSLHAAFLQVGGDLDVHANDTKLTGYWDLVYPQQLKVVAAFSVEGFERLGCPVWSYVEGEKLPTLIATLPIYQRELARLWDILEEAGAVVKKGNTFMRGPASSGNIKSGSNSNSASGIRSAKELSEELMAAFPQFASAHGLADLLGPYLAEYLTGQADPIAMLFGSDAGRTLLEDFYANGPDLRAATQRLYEFIAVAIRIPAAASSDEEPFRVLEVGAGTGGTTRHLVPLLQATGLPFTYTFTDVSASLVARAKSSSLLGNVPEVDYRKLDIEEPPPADLVVRYHVVVSSNCVHATRNLGSSLLHIRQLLRPRDGCLALIELTQKLAWYDLVWGLLDGWWLFDDGRTCALQKGASRESRGVYVICGLVAELDQPCPVRATSMLLTTPVPASPLERGCNIFLVPDGSGSGNVFNPLAPLLSTVDNVSIFALNSPFVRNDVAADLELDLNYSPIVEQQAAIYVAELKHRQPEGRYLFGGHSVGGIMAYEMSRQLLEQGDAVEKIFLIDTACLTYGNSLPRVLVDYLEHHSSVPKKGNKNSGSLFKSHYFTLAGRQSAVYKPTRLLGLSIPRYVLFSARHGVQKQTQTPQPEYSLSEKPIV